MAGTPTAVDALSRAYWKAEVQKYLDECTLPPIERMSDEQRQFFTCKKVEYNGKVVRSVFAARNDPRAAQILFEQALLTLKGNGFVGDELICLDDWVKKGAPKGPRGEKAVPETHKLAAQYFYERMTVGQSDDTEELVETVADDYPNDAHQHAALAARLQPCAFCEDARYRLNTKQAKMLLRELLGISKNTLGGILNKKPPKSRPN
jgi:hypothetical protein